MYFLWFLPAVLLAVPLYAVWRIRRSQTRELCDRIQSDVQPTIPDEVSPKSVGVQNRQMKWVSNDEFMTVLAECGDLIVVDLRVDAQSVPFPVSTALVLPVSLSELDTVLELLPADRSIAICGASDLSIYKLMTSRCMDGSAPLYVLDGDLRHAEAA